MHKSLTPIALFKRTTHLQHLPIRPIRPITTTRTTTTTTMVVKPKPKVLLLGPLDHAHSFWKSHIDPHAETLTCTATDRTDFISHCTSGKYDGVVAAYRTFSSISQTGPWDADLAANLPKSLHFVAHNGAGYDQLNMPALTAAKILATNVPTAVDDATADTALFLLLGALRNFSMTQFALRRGDWRGNPAPPLGHDPQGKVLGILGMGGIGRNLAKKATALGMQIVYHNRRRLDPDDEAGARYLSFEELLEQSDVLSVHVPLSDATRHLIGAKELGKCKKGVCVVNTARGAVIDEAALAEALDEGQVGSVGLDVYEEEPKVHEGLVKNERAFLLPHMGTWTKETQEKMEEWCIGNVECAIRGPKEWGRMSVVPEQKEMWEKWIKDGEPETRP